MIRAVLGAAALRGWSVEAVFSEGARTRAWVPGLREDGVEVRFLPVASRPALVRSVRDLVAESANPTVLHTHFTTFDLPALVAAVRRPQTAIFWHLHSFLRRELRFRVRNTVKFGLAGRLVEAIFCVGPHLAEGLVRRGTPESKVIVLPNAIDTARFPLIAEQEREDARGALGIPDGADVLLHFGWDWELKGGDLLLAAVKRLLDRGRTATLTVTVGGGERARSAVRALGLERAVRVVEPREDVRTLYAAADVFVAASRFEGTPTAVLQALSSGLPVVATEIPGHRSAAPPGDAVRFADLEGIALADTIDVILDGRAALAGERDAAHDWIAGHLDLSTWADRLLGYYEQAIRP
jgi:glycosyltransferase involved in cell wall biosynthesis